MRQLFNIVFVIALCACEQGGDLDPGQKVGPEGADGLQVLEPGGDIAPQTEAAPWLEPGHVESIDDLPGRYYQPFALPGQISVMTLGEMEQGTGEYDLYRSCGVPTCIAESGSYHAVPENPAIGFAFFTLNNAGVVPETYVIDLFWRTPDSAVVALQVRRLLPTNAFGPTTILWRLPEAGPGVVAKAGEPLDPADPEAALDGIESGWPAVPDIAGTFVRPFPVYGDIGALTFADVIAEEDEARAAGTYTAAYPYCLPWCFPEVGSFELEIANTLSGTGVLQLDAINGDDEKRYVVLAIWRTPQGIVGAVQLQRIYPFGVIGPPFTMYSQWWTNDDTIEAAASATCSYYQGLAEYYAIRALQCAYSVCYPLSPVYGYWAEYYQGLADAYCE